MSESDERSHNGRVPFRLMKARPMEKAQRRGLARLMLRWPQNRTALKTRFDSDARFAELCEAYEVACDAASYWDKSSSPAALERAQEYRSLMTATEQDILNRIS
ncbi:hypothetical protein AB4Z10_15205 [Bosea sp. RAF48]